jgi:hypothetical protein
MNFNLYQVQLKESKYSYINTLVTTIQSYCSYNILLL